MYYPAFNLHLNMGGGAMYYPALNLHLNMGVWLCIIQQLSCI